MSKLNEDQSSKIDKRESARRRLVEAIHLWIEARDRLVVHTLVMAAFGIKLLTPISESACTR